MLLCSRLLAGCFKHTQNLCKNSVGILADEETTKIEAFGRLNSMGNLAFIFAPSLAGWMAANVSFQFVFLLVSASFFLNSLLVYHYFPAESENRIMIRLQSSAAELLKKPRNAYNNNNSSNSNNSIVVTNGAGMAESEPTERSSPCNNMNPLASLMRHFNEVDWTSQWDLMLVRFLWSFVVLLYRANFNWLMSDKYGAGPATVGYLTSMQGIVGFLSSFYAKDVVRLLNVSASRCLTYFATLLSLSLFGMYYADSVHMYALSLCLMNCSSAWLRVLSIDLTVQRCALHDTGAVLGVGASVVASARAVTPAVGGLLHDYDREFPTLFGAAVAVLALITVKRFTVVNQKLFAIKR